MTRLFQKEIQNWISFIYAPLLAYIWCLSLLLSSLQTEDLMCFWCWSSHFWFCELSLCVQQNALPTWRPLCLFCALFLILKIRLLVVIQCFPVPSERTCTSLCLLGRSHLHIHLCKMLVHCAWPCSHIITKYVCYTIILCLCLASRQANTDSAQINALFRCGHYRPLFWLRSCKICLLERDVFAIKRISDSVWGSAVILFVNSFRAPLAN